MLLRIKQLKIGSYGIWACIIIVVATLLRVVLIAQGWPHSNSDEDTMGIMGMHIAYNGEHPIFFYGQQYMGTLQAYVAAAFFRIFGASVFTLRLGPVLIFALFLANMYLLTSLLYTKKLALITLVLLTLGSSIMLDTELVAIGGYPELLFFGSLSLLLATWLVLSFDHYSSPRRRVRRLIAYTCWGFVVGIGFWSDFLMLAFILVSGLLLLVFCWRELLSGYRSFQNVQCPMLQMNLSSVFIALAWSVGFILLWTIAVVLTLRDLLKNLWKLRMLKPGYPWSQAEKQAIKRHFARLMLLCSGGLTLLLFIMSPTSAVFPGNSRYLVGLLISTPAF